MVMVMVKDSDNDLKNLIDKSRSKIKFTNDFDCKNRVSILNITSCA